MDENFRDYLTYVRDVLGARQILAGKPRDPESSTLTELARTRTAHWPPAAPMDLIVLHQGEGLFEGETADLWEKMKSAMHLGAKRVLEIESLPGKDDMDGLVLEALQVFPADVVLILRADPARGGFRVLGGAQVSESFAPSILVGAPELKRDAWSDLQAVMRELGLGKN